MSFADKLKEGNALKLSAEILTKSSSMGEMVLAYWQQILFRKIFIKSRHRRFVSMRKGWVSSTSPRAMALKIFKWDRSLD